MPAGHGIEHEGDIADRASHRPFEELAVPVAFAHAAHVGGRTHQESHVEPHISAHRLRDRTPELDPITAAQALCATHRLTVQQRAVASLSLARGKPLSIPSLMHPAAAANRFSLCDVPA